MSILIISSSLICVCGCLPLQKHPVSPLPAPPGSPEELDKKSEPQGNQFAQATDNNVSTSAVGHAPSLLEPLGCTDSVMLKSRGQGDQY